MPPKKEKEIVPVFDIHQGNPWWQYQEYSEEKTAQINEFFNEFQVEIRAKLNENLWNNVQVVTQCIGSHIHPLFIEQPLYLIPVQQKKTEGDEDSLQQQGQQNQQEMLNMNQMNKQLQQLEELKDVNFLILSNYRLDYLTIKMIDFVWSHSQLNVIKFHNNHFDNKTLDLITEFITSPQCKIVKLFFEWNPMSSEKAQSFYRKIAQSQTIEFLILRCNNMNDEGLKALTQGIKENENCIIKFLDLYDNPLTKEGFDEIGQLLQNYKRIEYLGLAKMQIKNYDDLSEIFKNIGRQNLSLEDFEIYKLKEKERDEIIEKNKKLKKEPVTQNSDESWSIIRNEQFKMLNLSINQLNDNSKEQIEKFIQNITNDQFQLVLSHNKFDEKTREKLKKKYNKKMYI